jgi:ribonucleoside-diphosphate reductase beta chain
MGASCDKILDTSNLVPKGGKERIFLGEYSGFQRYDSPKYNFAVVQEEKQRNAFWNPNEISMLADEKKFFDLPEFIQEIMIRIWLFQTLMDSAQNSGLESVLAELCTNPEFEAMFKTQGYFELIHSLSYSHILRGIFADSGKIFDKIADIPEIQRRVDKEIVLYSKVKKLLIDGEHVFALNKRIDEEIKQYIEENNVTNEMELKRIHDVISISKKQIKVEFGSEVSEEEKNKTILELLVSILALEGVKFYVSFLVTYVINDYYRGSIPGATRMIKLINHDEDMHTAMTAGTIQILKKTQSEGMTELIASDWFKNMAQETFKEVLADELDWADYLLSFGDIPTLTKGVVEDFLKYYVDFRLHSIGVEKMYNVKKSDMVIWFEHTKDLNKENTAGQESDLAVYSVGIMKNDIPEGKMSFDDLES